MTLSRRELLVAATGLFATGCGIQSSGDPGPQTVGAPVAAATELQTLDPSLALSLPPKAVSPASVSRFGSETGVHVTVVQQPATAAFYDQLAAGQQGRLDVALVDRDELSYLLTQGLVEPVDRSLVPNLRLLAAPFSNPPYDPGGAHSVAKDYRVIGFAVSVDGLVQPSDTWQGFYRLAAELPGRVAVPDDAEVVVGTALLSLGHSWSSSSAGDLADAHHLLAGLRSSLVVTRPAGGRGLGRHVAMVGPGNHFRRLRHGARFVVPNEGSVILMRSYCILGLAPNPVSAHAWLNSSLDPFQVRQDVMQSKYASPVSEAEYLLPDDILTNTAIYPPASVADRLRFSTVTAAGVAARQALWADVHP
jgi:spermidine/putrescine transport system substrate-binding protein